MSHEYIIRSYADHLSPDQNTVRFCKFLTQDGVLTEDEVWHLANFLNENKPAREVWPGSVLFGALADVYADGIVTVEEMQGIGNLLIQIELECDKEFGCVEELDTSLQSGPPLLTPQLPVIPIAETVPSSSGADEYVVDLIKQTCSCPDWERRRKLPLGDLSRACKHMAIMLYENSEQYTWHDCLVAYLEHVTFRNTGEKPSSKWQLVEDNGKCLLVGYIKNDDWANVFAEGDSGFERFGYNISQKRWSYGDAPKGQRAVRKFFRNL